MTGEVTQFFVIPSTEECHKNHPLDRWQQAGWSFAMSQQTGVRSLFVGVIDDGVMCIPWQVLCFTKVLKCYPKVIKVGGKVLCFTKMIKMLKLINLSILVNAGNR